MSFSQNQRGRFGTYTTYHRLVVIEVNNALYYSTRQIQPLGIWMNLGHQNAEFQNAQLLLDVFELDVIEACEVLSDIIYGLQAHDLRG